MRLGPPLVQIRWQIRLLVIMYIIYKYSIYIYIPVGQGQHRDREEEEGQAEVDGVVVVGEPGREHGRAPLNGGNNP